MSTWKCRGMRGSAKDLHKFKMRLIIVVVCFLSTFGVLYCREVVEFEQHWAELLYLSKRGKGMMTMKGRGV